MDTALILARCLLAVVFAVAGAAKLGDLPGSRTALTGFGVRPALVPAGAVGLPVVELLTAVLLVAAPSAQLGGALAILLLAAFVTGIARALRQGRAPDCHCFGQLHSEPASRGTLVRNALLAVPALFVLVAGPGPGLVSWSGDEGARNVALVVTSTTTVLLGLLSLRLWHQGRGRPSQRAELPDYEAPLPEGQPLPDFEVHDLGTGQALGPSILAGERGVLAFVSATCGPCHELLPDLARWQDLLGERLALRVISAGDRQANVALSEEHGLPLLLDPESRASRAFRVPATPCAIEYDAQGRIASVPATGAASIEALIRSALKRRPDEPFALAITNGGAG